MSVVREFYLALSKMIDEFPGDEPIAMTMSAGDWKALHRALHLSMSPASDDGITVLQADGLADAVVGMVDLHNVPQPVLVYDAEKCIDIFVQRDGMTYEEAVEFFDFNTAGAYVGVQTPLFLYPVPDWLREQLK